jgi:5'-methylthioadenosine phosphorylase
MSSAMTSTSNKAYDGPRAEVGVIGGSGLYSLLDAAETVEVDTPFGPPSDPLTIGEAGSRRVAFVPRHGRDHRFPPHRVNYRANIWALRAVGARQILGPCAVGSLKAQHGAGTVVVPDQIVDRTWGRAHTFYDEVGAVVHVGFADPYCPNGRRVAVEQGRARGLDPVDGGTLVVVNGPRFSTRAESLWHQSQGWTVVGMTGSTEAALARELALCYTAISLVTDLDAGLEQGEGVTHEQVLRAFADNIEKVRALLLDVVAALPDASADCSCRHALDGLTLPFELP